MRTHTHTDTHLSVYLVPEEDKMLWSLWRQIHECVYVFVCVCGLSGLISEAYSEPLFGSIWKWGYLAIKLFLQFFLLFFFFVLLWAAVINLQRVFSACCNASVHVCLHPSTFFFYCFNSLCLRLPVQTVSHEPLLGPEAVLESSQAWREHWRRAPQQATCEQSDDVANSSDLI